MIRNLFALFASNEGLTTSLVRQVNINYKHELKIDTGRSFLTGDARPRFAGLRGSSLRFPPIEATKPEVPRQVHDSLNLTLCSRDRCGAREAMTDDGDI